MVIDMIKNYEISKAGKVVNRILADAAFCIDLVAAGEIDAFAEVQESAPLPQARIITKGAWLSRMGMDGLAIAGSTHPVCIAVSTALGLQRCVDLDHPETAQLLDLLIASSQPAASGMFPGSGPVTPAKKTAWLSANPTDAERFRE